MECFRDESRNGRSTPTWTQSIALLLHKTCFRPILLQTLKIMTTLNAVNAVEIFCMLSAHPVKNYVMSGAKLSLAQQLLAEHY